MLGDCEYLNEISRNGDFIDTIKFKEADMAKLSKIM